MDVVCLGIQRMHLGNAQSLHYKRSHFATRLPVGYAYTASHYWMAPQGDNEWRVGLTKFAVRMLGEMVDHGFETDLNSAVTCGQILGWIEGFKAISDLFCVGDGEFLGGNPVFPDRLTLVNKDCYGEGWLYLFRGAPDTRWIDAEAYARILDKTIDRIMEKQQNPEIQ
jgi:glycine cleavage system H protein